MRAPHVDRTWLVIAIVVGGVAIIVLALLYAFPPWHGQALPDVAIGLRDLEGDALADEMARREIVRIELENRAATSPWAPVLALVPVITASFAALAIVATIWKQINERAAQQRQEREERERESQRRFHEGFQTTVANLSAESPSLRASAAILLGTFLRPEYESYHDDVIAVALAKSKTGMEEDESVRRLVTRSLGLGLRARLDRIPEDVRPFFLDLSRCDLERIDLSGLDLSDADVAYANLRHANLRDAKLRRIKGIGVNLEHAQVSGASVDLAEARLREAVANEAHFHDARCISIRLEDARLRGAEFQRARLQEAHFEGADLRGAVFYGADVNNAYFAGATLDEAALRTIARGAKHWRKANFDDEQRERLLALASPPDEDVQGEGRRGMTPPATEGSARDNPANDEAPRAS